MMKIVVSSLFLSVAAFGQYTVDKAGAPPPEVPAPFSAMLQKEGIKVVQGGKSVADIWLRSATPPAHGPDMNVTLPIAQGTLVGVIRLPANFSDRRGQQLKAGLYTLRFSAFPQNGDHQGVAPQRDFFLLSPVAEDKDPNATPGFEELVGMSKKASGTPHPAVFSVWKGEAAGPSIEQSGENDWVLHAKIGDTPIAMIVVGRAEG